MKHLQPLYAVSALLLAAACPAAELAAPRPWLAFDRYEQYRRSRGSASNHFRRYYWL